jgi:DNA repair ATPase RecN
VALFGIKEMKAFASDSDDERVKALWKRLMESTSKNALWAAEATRLQKKVQELEAVDLTNCVPGNMAELHTENEKLRNKVAELTGLLQKAVVYVEDQAQQTLADGGYTSSHYELVSAIEKSIDRQPD